MPTTTEQDEMFKALRARLLTRSGVTAIVGTGTAARVYAEDQVPQSPTYPYLLIEFLSGSDMEGTATRRIASDLNARVTAVNRGPVDSTTRTLGYEADVALQTTAVYESGGWTFSVRRRRPFRRPLLDEANNKYGRTGGEYFVFAA
jgi:hypothetical protein